MVADGLAWCDNAVRVIEADARRSADTHLLKLPLARLGAWGERAERAGLALYLKDETTHITGSLKHRLARSLLLYALCNGWVGEGTALTEASSGSTAVSEAYFAKLLGLDFIAVMPRSTSKEKVRLIERQGGVCHFVDHAASMYTEAARLAQDRGGYYLDQFTNAERTTDWRGNNNIAESIFTQLELEERPVPEWIVVGAGTGGTSATIGRYIRYRRHPTKLCVVDPEGSAFAPAFAQFCATGVWSPEQHSGQPSRIEGIGRPRVEPSFIPGVVTRMIPVADACSIAAARWASEVLGFKVGSSTGTNLWGALILLGEMERAGGRGSVVTLIADDGERYLDTYFDDAWVAAQGIDLAPAASALRRLLAEGVRIGEGQPPDGPPGQAPTA